MIAGGLQAYVYYNTRAMGKMQGGHGAAPAPATEATQERQDGAGAGEGRGRRHGASVEAGESAGRVTRGASTDKRGLGSSPATSGRRRVSGWCSPLLRVYAHAHAYGLQAACVHACMDECLQACTYPKARANASKRSCKLM